MCADRAAGLTSKQIQAQLAQESETKGDHQSAGLAGLIHDCIDLEGHR